MKVYVVYKTSYELYGDDVSFEILKVFFNEEKAEKFSKEIAKETEADTDYDFYIDYKEMEVE